MAKREKGDPIVFDSPEDVALILSEFGDTAGYVSVWKLEGGKELFIDSISPDAWSLKWLRDLAGGGDYRIRIAGKTRARGKSQWLPGGTKTFQIWGASRDPSQSSQQGGQSSLMEKLLLATVPIAVAKLLADKPADPVLLSLLGNLGKGNGPSVVEIQQLAETARSQGFEQGKSLGRAEALSENAGDGDSPLVAAIHELGPVLQGAMKTTEPKAAARGTATIAADPATVAAAATAASAPSWVARVRPLVRHMLAWADAKMTPETKATNMLEDLRHMAPDDYDALGVSCESDSFVHDVLSTWLPELASSDARRDWFTAFLSTIQNTLAPVETGNDEADDEEPEGGTAGTGGSGGADSGQRTDGASAVASAGRARPSVLRESVAEDDGPEVAARARARGSKRGAGGAGKKHRTS